MDTGIQLKRLKSEFHFDKVDRDPHLANEAELRLMELLSLAPPGATGAGLLESSEGAYLSTVTIQSPFRNFTAKAMGTEPKTAVNRSLERLENELVRWRFGGGSGNHGPHLKAPTAGALQSAGG